MACPPVIQVLKIIAEVFWPQKIQQIHTNSTLDATRVGVAEVMICSCLAGQGAANENWKPHQLVV